TAFYIVEEAGIDVGEEHRLVIRSTAEHDARDVLQVRFGLIEVGNAAVDRDRIWRQALRQPIDTWIVQRRDRAVLFRRQALEPCLAGMDIDVRRPRLDHEVDEAGEALLGILIVDPETTLDGDWNVGRITHGADAVGDERRLGHEAGAEAAGLHAIGRTADIEVDFVVTEFGADT